MAIFGPKPSVNHFGKISIFRLFKLFVFIAQKGVLFVLEYRKRNFPSLYCLKKKKLKTWPFLDQNHGLTPLEKWQFFDFLNFLFLQPRKMFFVLECFKRHFPGLFSLKKKKLEKWQYLDQNHGLTPLQKWQFYDFLNFLFLQPRKMFFRSRMS